MRKKTTKLMAFSPHENLQSFLKKSLFKHIAKYEDKREREEDLELLQNIQRSPNQSIIEGSQTKLSHPPSKISIEQGNNAHLVEAATKIQAALRGYLARRALKSLKALVRIQAIVRGHYIRKRADVTLQCIKSLLRIQERVRQQRLISLKNNRKFTQTRFHGEDPFCGEVAEHQYKFMSMDDKSSREAWDYRNLTTEQVLDKLQRNRERGMTSPDYFSHQILSKTVPASVNGESKEAITTFSSLEPFNYHDNDASSVKMVDEGRIKPDRKPINHLHQSPLTPPLSKNRPYHTPSPSPKKFKLKNHKEDAEERTQVWDGGCSNSTPPTPNYMTFTASSKAKIRSQISSSVRKRVSFPAINSASNSPRQTSLHMKNSLPPIRTERSRVSLTESNGGDTNTPSIGKFRRLMI
ncbi:protein IQ-DOMAIN 17-like [Tasmannia lanceolata]|uniref:protein IQ-DOMAIN 17-like n=1 Tax=Tasmannia lanceolata TaxID=3420 RepID=UPI0040633B20